MKKLKVFGLVLVGAAVLFGAVALADTVYQPSALFDTQLNVAMDNVSTSTMTLQLGVDKSGNALNAFMCFTIDGGLSNVEYVCGSASGTVVSNLVRGIDFTDGVTTSTSRYQKHRIGADVKQTDYPYLSQIARLLGGTGTFPAILNYASNINSGSFTSPTQIITKSYADSLSFAGAPNGNLSTKGIYQEATRAQVALGNATGTTGADLIVPNLYFNATPSATTTVPVTNASGTLVSGFIAQDASSTYNFLGSVTLASETLSNATSGLIFANASGSLSAIAKSASTGSILSFNNNTWQAGLVQSYQNFSSTLTTTTLQNISSTTLPLAATGSIYEFTINYVDNANGASTTVYIGNQAASTTIFTCNIAGNPSGLSIYGKIIMENATNSEQVFVTSNSNQQCTPNTTLFDQLLNLNLSTTTSLNVSVKNAAATGAITTVTSSIYMIQ